MPLNPKKTISQLVEQMRKEGKPQKQAVAIAYSVKDKKKNGK